MNDIGWTNSEAAALRRIAGWTKRSEREGGQYQNNGYVSPSSAGTGT
ncbi:hypothetical protein [Streptomyces camponoticapitis]|nr:hypothetical protein [Streptomyces camponoticapitis]